MRVFKSAATDYAAIGKEYRERFGGNPFGIEPGPPPKPPLICEWCGARYIPGSGWDGCSGMCSGF